MDEARGRALAAGFSRGIGEAAAALGALGYASVARARDGASALRMIAEAEPEVAVCDAVLPGMDGAALIERIRRLRLNVQPALLLLKPPGLRLPGEDALAALGARVIEPPATPERLARALEGLTCPLPPEKAARLEALLDALGVPEHPGRECLRRAVALAWADRRTLRALRASLYPRACAETGLTPVQAERAIRHAIDVAWREGAIEQQHRVFGETIDARRGKPTCGEMIAQLAEELRWEE